jgi:CubicO group peptidase (beta-lactamase class C family)
MPSPSASPSVSPTGSPLAECPGAGADAIDCRLENLGQIAGQGGFDGVILVAHDGRPIWHQAFGKDSSGRPSGLDSKFGTASAGKMFTAVAVAQLAEAGKLSFDDPVSKFVTVPADVGRATIGQLLSHTAGLGMMSWAEGVVSEPGTFNYSNAGFNLLALVVEQVADELFDDYVQRNVFDRAGMSSTKVSREQPRGAPIGAGGPDSTTEDLLRFANALLAYRLVGKAVTTEITSKHVDTEFGGYGYGFAIFAGEHGEVPSVGHIGEFMGLTSALEMNPTLDYTVIVLSDRGFGLIEPALDALQQEIGMGYWRP